MGCILFVLGVLQNLSDLKEYLEELLELLLSVALLASTVRVLGCRSVAPIC
jgi:hypothetical protein